MPRKEINTALASNKNIPVNEPKAPTKNIAGPPVYYPPGQELFAKSEAQAALRARVCVCLWDMIDLLFTWLNGQKQQNIEMIALSKWVECLFDFRVAMQKEAANMNMKLRANRKVRVNRVLLLFQFVYHYAVPCHAQSCRSINKRFRYFHNECINCTQNFCGIQPQRTHCFFYQFIYILTIAFQMNVCNRELNNYYLFSTWKSGFLVFCKIEHMQKKQENHLWSIEYTGRQFRLLSIGIAKSTNLEQMLKTSLILFLLCTFNRIMSNPYIYFISVLCRWICYWIFRKIILNIGMYGKIEQTNKKYQQLICHRSRMNNKSSI